MENTHCSYCNKKIKGVPKFRRVSSREVGRLGHNRELFFCSRRCEIKKISGGTVPYGLIERILWRIFG